LRRIALTLGFVAACGAKPAPAALDGGEDASSDAQQIPDAEDASPADSGATMTSFAFVGCNRLDKADWDAVGNPSSANVPQLAQTFADLAATSPLPKLFFMAGDLVLGLSDTPTLSAQLAAWTPLWKASAPTTLVALPGNHEMLVKQKVNGTTVEVSNPGADAAWTQWLSASGFGAFAGNGPTMGSDPADALMDDQSALSYSFDQGGLHFVLLNTDTWTSTVDADTLTKANGNVSAIFVLGHKPLVSPKGDTAYDATIDVSLVPALEQLFDATPKVKAYLAAHAHSWDAQKLPGARSVYQIVAGNGGSPPAGSWASPFFGFTEVRVHANGSVGVVSHERPVPTPYSAGPAAPAVAGAELVIAGP
jgi:hypothetical protein